VPSATIVFELYDFLILIFLLFLKANILFSFFMKIFYCDKILVRRSKMSLGGGSMHVRHHTFTIIISFNEE